jgi:hypothetical protein
MARRRSQAIRKPQETPEQIERRVVVERTTAIGLSVPALRLVEMVPVVAKLEAHGERGGGKTVRVVDELGKLALAHHLTKRQYDAGREFDRLFYEAGLNAGRAQDYSATRGGGMPNTCPLPLHMAAVNARRQLNHIRTYLGPHDETLLIRIIVEGKPIGGRDTGAERHRYANALAWLCKALDRVASAARL